MVKIIALIKRRKSMTREEFLEHWHAAHPPYVWALPGLRRYVQNPAIAHHRQWEYDGAAELWFDSVKDVAIAFDSEVAEPMHQHEKAFIEDITWFLAEEVEVDKTSQAGNA